MKSKLILTALSICLFIGYGCKKEKPKLKPSGTTTNPSGAKIYTYNKAYVKSVKFYALSSSYINDYMRYEVDKGSATLRQSTSDTYYGSLPFLIDDYMSSIQYYINDLSAQHTLYLDYYSSSASTWYYFVNWNFTPQNYMPSPSTQPTRDTIIELQTGATIYDVTFSFQGI